MPTKQIICYEVDGDANPYFEDKRILDDDPKIPRGFGDLLKENTINKCIEIEVNKKYIQAMGITKLSDLHKKLYTSPWMIVHNHTNIPFITGDNPSKE